MHVRTGVQNGGDNREPYVFIVRESTRVGAFQDST
jgi:hypothetical protein